MGSINISGAGLFESLSDIVGFKSGLALGKKAIVDLLLKEKELEEFATVADDDHLRIESIVFEDLVRYLLYRVGRLESPRYRPPVSALHHKYKHDKVQYAIAMEIASAFTDYLNAALLDPQLVSGTSIDPTSFIEQVASKYGAPGVEMAIHLIRAFDAFMVGNPWGQMFREDWRDTIDLKDLFESEGLEAQFGTFVDQRYIDYLHRNFDDIDRINWRKFEGLTGEYFTSLGFDVQIGSGRNDGGIDMRMWPSESKRNLPPAVIVQCKREKRKIPKVVVKALYADVVCERAQSGLIVTTSALSLGARKVCVARGYPIKEADREMLRRWIAELRKPGSGDAT